MKRRSEQTEDRITWAARVARMAMGKSKVRAGREFVEVWNADEDPLAWWCLTELIADGPKRRRE